ncbi:lytic transglycosylase domain-containing protein [Allokutzneria oryzae]|uniref:Lytic transglycosylase domain-containing protein n=1 Tax=Allokutzneria oryzae TaxID=1378989 RepID=A0ABV6A6D0_9PSEU
MTALLVPLAFGSVRTHHSTEPVRAVSVTHTLLGRDLVRAIGDLGATGRLPTADEASRQLVDALRDGPDLTESATASPPWEDAPYDPVRDAALGIAGPVLDAYIRADQTLARSTPDCGLHWSYLAGIGKVESNHARGQVDVNGTTPVPILGPVLDGGPGMAAIADTDGGRLDGDPVWDRAVGPMQFIPRTWARYGADGNGDGKVDPHNIYDAALSAGRYLCSGGLDLRKPEELVTAIFRYNHSNAYVSRVLGLAVAYSLGVSPLPTPPLPALPPLTQRLKPAAAPAPAPTTTAAPPAPTATPPPCEPVSSTRRRPTTTTSPTGSTTPPPTATSVPCVSATPPPATTDTTKSTSATRPTRRPVPRPTSPEPSVTPTPSSPPPGASTSPARGSTTGSTSRPGSATPTGS